MNRKIFTILSVTLLIVIGVGAYWIITNFPGRRNTHLSRPLMIIPLSGVMDKEEYFHLIYSDGKYLKVDKNGKILVNRLLPSEEVRTGTCSEYLTYYKQLSSITIDYNNLLHIISGNKYINLTTDGKTVKESDIPIPPS